MPVFRKVGASKFDTRQLLDFPECPDLDLLALVVSGFKRTSGYRTPPDRVTALVSDNVASGFEELFV